MPGRMLIDKAIKVCGTEAELARRLDVSRAMVNMLAKGKRPLSPEMAGLLAEITGEEIAPAVLEAVLDGFSKSERGQRVREAMHTAFLVGAAATFGTFATQNEPRRTAETSQNETTSQPTVDNVRIVSRRGFLFIRTRLMLSVFQQTARDLMTVMRWRQVAVPVL